MRRAHSQSPEGVSSAKSTNFSALHAGLYFKVDSDDPAYFRSAWTTLVVRSTEAMGLTADEQLTVADNSLRTAFMNNKYRLIIDNMRRPVSSHSGVR